MFQYHFFIGSFFNSFQSLIIQKRSHALKSTFKSCLKTKRNFKEVQGTQKTSFTMSKAQPKSLTLEQIKNKKPGFLFFKALNESGVGLDCQRFLTVKIDLGPKGFSFLFALHKAGVKGPPALPFLMYRVCWRALKVNF